MKKNNSRINVMIYIPLKMIEKTNKRIDVT